MGAGLDLHARRADGREFPVDIALTPITVSGRRLVACAIRDQSRRMQAPESLRVQATALRSAANGVVITDRAGIIIWVNPAACSITGYSWDELVGRHTRILKSGRHEPSFYADLWKTVTRGDTWSGTIVNRRKDGTVYDEEQTIAPVLDDQGAITHFIAIKQDVTEARRTQEDLQQAGETLALKLQEIEVLNEKLREQAVRDPLTGLYNRRYLDETIAREVAQVSRSGLPLTVAALDIDRFKLVNDTHGHAAGDQVLLWMANVLRGFVRASDLVCRSGGEEFVVVMPGATVAAALARAERWRATFAREPVRLRDGVTVSCTVSIGIALYRSRKETFDACLARADAALYEAKRAGRDRVVSAENGAQPDPPRSSSA
jgi:diguanylate cyclase (GGDEF)-like protein/PAS domain S-box-containing protein